VAPATNDYPTNETVNRLYDEMDFQRAAQAYLWSMPLVTAASIRLGLFRDLGVSYYDIVLYENFLDSKSIYFTGNNVTIYGAGIFDIGKDGPAVLEVPAGPSAGMLNDFWWRTSGIGNLGPDKGKGGKFLIVPPGYQNDLPAEGYFIVHAKMNDYMFFLRGFVVNGNVPGASELFHKTRIYPYNQRNNPKPNRVVPATGKYVNTVEPEGLAYWKLLSDVIGRQVIRDVDHRNLNTDVAWLKGLVPTTENLAQAVWERLQPELPDGLLRSVRIWETDKNWAEVGDQA